MQLSRVIAAKVLRRSSSRPPPARPNAGAIDPLPELEAIARRHGLWYHVDAAWAGAVALLPEKRTLLSGIERADSVTLDAHKWLSAPMGAGLVLTTKPGALRDAFGQDNPYMPREASGDVTDLYQMGLQWSRRFHGMKLFLSLLIHGWDGYRAAIRHMFEMGDLLESRLEGKTTGRSSIRPPLPLSCFVDVRDPSPDQVEAIRAKVFDSGAAWISSTVLGGSRPALRALRHELPHSARRHRSAGRRTGGCAMNRDDFQDLVDEAWERIPQRFRDHFQNVAIFVADEPGQEHFQAARTPPGHTLLGPLSRHPARQARLGLQHGDARSGDAVPGAHRACGEIAKGCAADRLRHAVARAGAPLGDGRGRGAGGGATQGCSRLIEPQPRGCGPRRRARQGLDLREAATVNLDRVRFAHVSLD